MEEKDTRKNPRKGSRTKIGIRRNGIKELI
jgi:hypothetical protein